MEGAIASSPRSRPPPYRGADAFAVTVTGMRAALDGRYPIESELGEGGMATVYLAEDIKPCRAGGPPRPADGLSIEAAAAPPHAKVQTICPIELAESARLSVQITYGPHKDILLSLSLLVLYKISPELAMLLH